MKQYFALGALGALLAIIVAALPACLTVRQSGAHDTTINIVGDTNSLSMAAHRENSAQDAKSDPKLGVDPKLDLTIPVVP